MPDRFLTPDEADMLKREAMPICVNHGVILARLNRMIDTHTITERKARILTAPEEE